MAWHRQTWVMTCSRGNDNDDDDDNDNEGKGHLTLRAAAYRDEGQFSLTPVNDGEDDDKAASCFRSSRGETSASVVIWHAYSGWLALTHRKFLPMTVQ